MAQHDDGRRAGLDRRQFLAFLGAAGAAGALVSLEPTWFDLPAMAADAPAIDPNFPLGVASGDPRPDGTVLWTQVNGAADTGGGIPVRWEVSDTTAFTTILASGSTTAVADADHTVHVTVTGLPSDGWFHYRFTAGANTSRTGRLRTAPAPGSSAERLRFAWSSCQQITSSYYVAHAAMAAEDLDFVVHYGDYVYVSDGGTITLDDYRGVYRRFKANPLLQELHATYPMVCMWDDGEFVNGIDSTLDPVRFEAAARAWFEFMPVDRDPDEPNRTYRELVWGDLVDFLLLDVRQYRSKAVDANEQDTLLPTTDTNLPSGAVIFDPDRTALGAAQKSWLKDRLVASEQTWRHIGHGYNFVALRLEDYDTPEARLDPPPNWHVNGGKYLSTEAWDGYWAERKELMEHLAANCVPNVVVTAGHTHIYFAAGLRPDFDDLDRSPVVAREFVCGSLTADPDPRSQFFPDLPPEQAEASIHALEGAFLGLNPHIDDVDLLNQGYGIVTFSPTEAVVDFRIIDTFDADAVATTRKSFTIAEGELPTTFDGTCGVAEPTTTTTTTTTTPTDPVAPPAAPVSGTADFTG